MTTADHPLAAALDTPFGRRLAGTPGDAGVAAALADLVAARCPGPAGEAVPEFLRRRAAAEPLTAQAAALRAAVPYLLPPPPDAARWVVEIIPPDSLEVTAVRPTSRTEYAVQSAGGGPPAGGEWDTVVSAVAADGTPDLDIFGRRVLGDENLYHVRFGPALPVFAAGRVAVLAPWDPAGPAAWLAAAYPLEGVVPVEARPVATRVSVVLPGGPAWPELRPIARGRSRPYSYRTVYRFHNDGSPLAAAAADPLRLADDLRGAYVPAEWATDADHDPTCESGDFLTAASALAALGRRVAAQVRGLTHR